MMETQATKLSQWTTELEGELQGLDLWEQRAQLEARIQRADRWLAKHPQADATAFERLEALAERHASVVEKINALSAGGASLIGLVLPGDFGGAVPPRWDYLPDGRIMAWFTRAELEAATLVNNALADVALGTLAAAA